MSLWPWEYSNRNRNICMEYKKNKGSFDERFIKRKSPTKNLLSSNPPSHRPWGQDEILYFFVVNTVKIANSSNIILKIWIMNIRRMHPTTCSSCKLTSIAIKLTLYTVLLHTSYRRYSSHGLSYWIIRMLGFCRYRCDVLKTICYFSLQV